MPIYKYKTFKEAECDLWIMHPDEKSIEKALNFIVFGLDLAKSSEMRKKIKKGFTLYKTLEESNDEY
ncbi:MAG: hypothetical protein M0016_00500 [Deltaproteobacteria bacterium]|jgi:hypothetical protein|nr:hypothetical protein [Deltaproteobacteria bacterium]MDA8303639.1 hypothetical protein [Deltaproteobacteria bacterium]